MKYNLVGSSGVIFTHSYGLGLKLKDSLGGYIDSGVGDTIYPSYLDDVECIKLYSVKNNKIKRLIKKTFKFFGFDRISLVIKYLNDRDGKISPETCEKIANFKNRESCNNFLFVWSTTIKKEKKIIDKVYSGVECKSVLVVNTYPVRGNSLYKDDDSKLFENDIDFFNGFDKIIVTSEIMKSYFISNGLAIESNLHVSPDFLPGSCYVKRNKLFDKIERLNKKKLIYLGNTNFSERSIDDTSLLLMELANRGFEIWIQKNDDKVRHRNIHLFEPFTMEGILTGKLGDFVSDFDAALVVYNNVNNARTNMGFPTRYALALTGHVPILLKSRVFLALEEKFADMNILYDEVNEIEASLKSFSLPHNWINIYDQNLKNYSDLIEVLIQED
ncbi:hypothetical protein [Vibrio splendidus]|uniref:hypothetical protein n=1 Tax=Vibrio splendidus TaxID=29497 RepID=UPI000D394AE9|nr:hypothetical protein [Vibrio splendidus]PTP73713.1 hypothetical protein CWO06_16335 [Vibrio splendidus]